LARAIIGGLLASTLTSVFAVPAAYFLVYRHRDLRPAIDPPGGNA
jgi:Cu/Ag efflux pump CusA